MSVLRYYSLVQLIFKNMIYLKSLIIYQSSSYCPFSYNLSVGNPGNLTGCVFSIVCIFAGCTFLVQFRMFLQIGRWIQRIHETQDCTSGKIIGGVSQDYRRHMMSSHLYNVLLALLMGFPGVSDGKVSACNAGYLGSIPGSGRSPGEGNGNPLQYSWPKNFMA